MRVRLKYTNVGNNTSIGKGNALYRLVQRIFYRRQRPLLKKAPDETIRGFFNKVKP